MRAVARPLLPPLGIGAAVAAALLARLLVAGAGGASSSLPAAAAFAALLLCVGALAPRHRRLAPDAPARTRRASAMRAVALGAGGGAVLVVMAAALRGSPAHVWPRPSGAQVLPWTALVVCVAAAEELVFRGVLFDAVSRLSGATVAALVCALAFALVHVPLYGWGVVPLDAGVGMWLGGLRLLSGGVAAPALAHALADCGAWLLL
ncbi:MAG TPA: CPBP family intramembrane glutamic endopeptidase [Candidatus Dormibacteraeota bacterium]|nr:CPBP family intramembrane glutamic endopeptidase [Candidatus Dormibacteraeota bacterium]